MPALTSDLATLSAPCLVRVKTSVRVQGVSRSQWVSSCSFCFWSTKNTDCRIASTVTVAGATRTSTGSVSHWSASVRMSGASVAENSSVCRCRGTFCDDPPQIVDKAHVEHPIGLVEDQHLDVRQVHVALLHQVQQPARRGDQDIHAVVQGADLGRLAHAAIDRGLPHGRIAAIGLETLADLQRQLARRGEHQRADLASAPIHAALGPAEPLQGGQSERGRLAGSGLRQPSTSRPSRIGGMAAA